MRCQCQNIEWEMEFPWNSCEVNLEKLNNESLIQWQTWQLQIQLESQHNIHYSLNNYFHLNW